MRQISAKLAHKLDKGELGKRADEDVGRIADQGGGAPDIGGEDLGNQKGDGVDFQGDGDLDGHRNHEQHGGDVVQEGGGDGGHHHEDARQDEDIPPGQGIGFVGQPLEQAGLFQDPDDDHHAHEEKDDVQVDGPHGVFEGENEITFYRRFPGYS